MVIQRLNWAAIGPTALFVLLWSAGAIFSKWGLEHASAFAFLLLHFGRAEFQLGPSALPLHQHGANLTESSNGDFSFLPVQSDCMSTAQTTTVVNRPALAGVVARVQAAVACLPVTPPGVAIVAAVASPPPAH